MDNEDSDGERIPDIVALLTKVKHSDGSEKGNGSLGVIADEGHDGVAGNNTVEGWKFRFVAEFQCFFPILNAALLDSSLVEAFAPELRTSLEFSEHLGLGHACADVLGDADNVKEARVPPHLLDLAISECPLVVLEDGGPNLFLGSANRGFLKDCVSNTTTKAQKLIKGSEGWNTLAPKRHIKSRQYIP